MLNTYLALRNLSWTCRSVQRVGIRNKRCIRLPIIYTQPSMPYFLSAMIRSNVQCEIFLSIRFIIARAKLAIWAVEFKGMMPLIRFQPLLSGMFLWEYFLFYAELKLQNFLASTFLLPVAIGARKTTKKTLLFTWTKSCACTISVSQVLVLRKGWSSSVLFLSLSSTSIRSSAWWGYFVYHL